MLNLFWKLSNKLSEVNILNNHFSTKDYKMHNILSHTPLLLYYTYLISDWDYKIYNALLTHIKNNPYYHYCIIINNLIHINT